MALVTQLQLEHCYKNERFPIDKLNIDKNDKREKFCKIMGNDLSFYSHYVIICVNSELI